MFNLPNKKIVKEAQRQLCLSPSFWTKIKSGKIPYSYNKHTNELKEATYNEVFTYINKGAGEVYWITDEELARVTDALTKTWELFNEIKVKQSQLNKYK